MFFPRLRRQAKWMFVFLAVIFGLGYVIFNVGGTIPGTGLGDILSGLGQGSSGPSVSDARNKIEDHPNDPAGPATSASDRVDTAETRCLSCPR